MKNKNNTLPFIIPLILLGISLNYSFDVYCLERFKKATWIKPLERGILNVGRFTYEYTASRYQYEGTLRILQNRKVLFTDKVGDVGEVTWYDPPPPKLEPFQMITPNPKDPPVVLFYSLKGRYELELRIYSTTEPKLLDVLWVGEFGVEIKDIDNDEILEFDTVNSFKIPFPYPKGYYVRAIYHFNKTKFELVKGGNFRSLFLKWAEEEYHKYESLYRKYKAEAYNKIIDDMRDENRNWKERDWRYSSGLAHEAIGIYRMMLKHLGAWLAQIESTGDREKIKEALNKFREILYLSREEKEKMIEYLSNAGYTGLSLKK